MGLDDIVDTGKEDDTTTDEVEEPKEDDERLSRMYKLVIDYDKRMEHMERRIKVLETLMADYVIGSDESITGDMQNQDDEQWNATADSWLDDK